MKNAHLRWVGEQEGRRLGRFAERISERVPAHARIVQAAAQLWKEAQRSAPTTLRPVWPAFLQTEVPETLLRAVIAVLEDRLPEEHDDLALWLGGRALGVAIAESPPEPRLLQEILARRQAHVPFLSAFRASFSAALADDPIQRIRWIDFLAKLRFEPQPPAHPEQARHMQDLMQRWQQRRSSFELWSIREFSSERFELSLDVGHQLTYLSWLLEIDASAWLRAVAALPHPALVEHVMLIDQVVDDEARLLTLLRDAPPEDSERPLAATTVLYLFKGMERHLRRVHGALSELVQQGTWDPQAGLMAQEAQVRLSRFQEEESPRWLRSCFEAVLERGDGGVLTVRLSAQLLREELRLPRGTRHREWSAKTPMLRVLCAVLAAHGVGVEQVRALWEQGEASGEPADNSWPLSTVDAEDRAGEGGVTLKTVGFPLWLTALGLERERGDSPLPVPIRERLWTWLVELLKGGDAGLRLLDLLAAQEPEEWLVWAQQQLAWLWSEQEDPTAALRDVYVQLEPQRRRALYRSDYSREAKGSELLLRLAQHCAEILAQTRGEGALGGTLFMDAFRWLHQLYLRQTPSRTVARYEVLRQLMAESFAFLPAIYRAELRPVLEVMLPLIADDAWVVTRAAAGLERNGVARESIVQLFTEFGVDLQAAAEEVQQWEPQRAG